VIKDSGSGTPFSHPHPRPVFRVPVLLLGLDLSPNPSPRLPRFNSIHAPSPHSSHPLSPYFPFIFLGCIPVFDQTFLVHFAPTRDLLYLTGSPNHFTARDSGQGSSPSACGSLHPSSLTSLPGRGRARERSVVHKAKASERQLILLRV